MGDGLMLLDAAVQGELPSLQRESESLMTLTFAAYSPDPDATTTDADGYEVPGYAPKGSTFGKVQGSSAATADASTRAVAIGGVVRPVLEAGLHIPVSAPVPVAGDYRIGWEYECTSVGPYDDPSLLGRRYLVVSAPAKSFATARRLDVAEIPLRPEPPEEES
jgi:hypothetical protein